MKTITQFAVFSLLFFSGVLQASTLTGGEMTYRYIGDSTNVNHQYEVTLVIYRTSRWSTFMPPVSVPLCVTSSCFPDITFTMPAHAGFTPPGQFIDGNDCVFPGPNTVTTSKMLYRTVVTLPGICHDFRFRSTPPISRVIANNVRNIQSWGTSGNHPHFLAYLNNTLGNNNSPQFTSDPQIGYCYGQSVNMIQNVAEVDGDSLVFSIVNSRSTSSSLGSCIQNSSLSNSVYSSNYSSERPFDSHGGVNITIDETNGNISFFAGLSDGPFMLAIAILEYRMDPVDSSFQIVGRVSREVLVTFEVCPGNQIGFSFLNESSSPVPQIGAYIHKPITTDNRVFFLGFQPSDSTASSLSPTGYFFSMLDVPFDCRDTLIDLHLSRAILNSSVNSDNIFVVGPDTQAIATQAVHFNNSALSDVITLELSQPLNFNGQHFIIFANDPQSPMINICGLEFSDTLVFSLTASNCPDFVSTSDYQLKEADIKLSPNPTDGIVTIQNASPSLLNFTVFDLRGVGYHSGSIGSGLELSVDISELPAGMYIVSFVDEKGLVKRMKVVKR